MPVDLGPLGAEDLADYIGEAHEQNWQRAKGFLAAVSVLFAVLEVAVEAWHRH